MKRSAKWSVSAVAIACLFLAQAATAQTPKKVSVAVEDDPASQLVGSQLKAKIGSTSRYTIVTDASFEILLSVSCLPSKTTGGYELGVFCSSSVMMYPFPSGLSELLTGNRIACDSTGQYCAEGLFENFVEGTQDEKLKQATAALYKSVHRTAEYFGWVKPE
jgi:hypothetical protein